MQCDAGAPMTPSLSRSGCAGRWRLKRPHRLASHGVADFAVGDLARANGFCGLGTHGSAVGGGLVGGNARASRFHAVCFGFYHGLCADFGAGALGFELGRKLRSISFVSVGAQRGESGNSSDGVILPVPDAIARKSLRNTRTGNA